MLGRLSIAVPGTCLRGVWSFASVLRPRGHFGWAFAGTMRCLLLASKGGTRCAGPWPPRCVTSFCPSMVLQTWVGFLRRLCAGDWVCAGRLPTKRARAPTSRHLCTLLVGTRQPSTRAWVCVSAFVCVLGISSSVSGRYRSNLEPQATSVVATLTPVGL